MGTVGQSTCDCKRWLVGRRAFVGLPSWHCSCRDGLLELIVPRAPSSRSLRAGWPTGLVGWLLMCGIALLVRQVNVRLFPEIKLI